MLTKIDRDIWIADGPHVSFYGFPYPTRMTIVRLRGGGLWICSPIPTSAVSADEISRLGPVQHLVSPNKIHHLFLVEWKAAWPEAKLWAPPGLARRRPDLSFDGELGDEPAAAWAGEIDQVIFHGSFAVEEVVFFHHASRTAVVTDLVQRFEASTLPWWCRPIMRLEGLVGPEGSTPREWRLSFWKRDAARAARRKTLGWNPERVIIAHGECIQSHGRAVLERALSWLD
jgi:hypothetical protein